MLKGFTLDLLLLIRWKREKGKSTNTATYCKNCYSTGQWNDFHFAYRSLRILTKNNSERHVHKKVEKLSARCLPSLKIFYLEKKFQYSI